MGFCLPVPVPAQDLQGLQYFRLLGPLFDHLHTAGTERDRAGNRQLFYDQYATLVLLYFFNPTVTATDDHLGPGASAVRHPADRAGGAQ